MTRTNYKGLGGSKLPMSRRWSRPAERQKLNSIDEIQSKHWLSIL